MLYAFILQKSQFLFLRMYFLWNVCKSDDEAGEEIKPQDKKLMWQWETDIERGQSREGEEGRREKCTWDGEVCSERERRRGDANQVKRHKRLSQVGWGGNKEEVAEKQGVLQFLSTSNRDESISFTFPDSYFLSTALLVVSVFIPTIPKSGKNIIFTLATPWMAPCW